MTRSRMKPNKPFAGPTLPYEIEYVNDDSDDNTEDDISWAKSCQDRGYRNFQVPPLRIYSEFPAETYDVKKSSAHTITRTNKASPKLKEKTIARYAFDVLLTNSNPIHITDLICILRRKNKLRRYSQLHCYSSVHKALSRNHHFFRQVESGIFTVRDGFRKPKEKAKIETKKKLQPKISIPLVIELVEKIIKQTMPNKKASASEVYISLKELGFSGRFQQVKEALKDHKFKKNREVFSLRAK